MGEEASALTADVKKNHHVCVFIYTTNTLVILRCLFFTISGASTEEERYFRAKEMYVSLILIVCKLPKGHIMIATTWETWDHCKASEHQVFLTCSDSSGKKKTLRDQKLKSFFLEKQGFAQIAPEQPKIIALQNLGSWCGIWLGGGIGIPQLWKFLKCRVPKVNQNTSTPGPPSLFAPGTTQLSHPLAFSIDSPSSCSH